MAKTFGWDFYQNLNALDKNLTPSSASGRTRHVRSWMVHNTVFQVVTSW